MNQCTITNINCLKARDLFSPWLDGEATPEESGLLEVHIKTCRQCSEELQAWKSLSDDFKKIKYPLDIPDDFTNRIMGQIKAEKHRKVAFFHNTRLKVAASAASLLVLAGSIGLINNFLPDKKVNIAKFDPKPAVTEVVKPGPDQRKDTVETPPATETAPSAANQGTEAGAEAGQPQADVTTSKNAPPGGHYTAQQELALLDDDIKIKSTLVKLVSVDPSGIINKATGMAAGAGTVSRPYSGQNTEGQTISVITITVPEKESTGLINSLTALGKVSDKSDETQDITYKYKECLARQQELSSLLNNPAGDKASYQTEYDSLTTQLREWKEQASNHTITLCVAKGQGN